MKSEIFLQHEILTEEKLSPILQFGEMPFLGACISWYEGTADFQIIVQLQKKLKTDSDWNVVKEFIIDGLEGALAIDGHNYDSPGEEWMIRLQLRPIAGSGKLFGIVRA